MSDDKEILESRLIKAGAPAVAVAALFTRLQLRRSGERAVLACTNWDTKLQVEKELGRYLAAVLGERGYLVTAPPGFERA